MPLITLYHAIFDTFNTYGAVGYFVRTSGNVADKMIKNYIENYFKREDKFGDFQVKN
ncbi:hypothetical protein Wxf_00835 [Wolbachia endosymbiont of Armadillidium vulgare]|nr:hypothetical protein Wxf_00835 [Wolbachia endosymbiont of Armadillidium vulgare]